MVVGQAVKSQLGKFWSQDYKKEKVEELRELINRIEKVDSTELVELIPKAVAIMIRLYDWALAGEQDDYQILSDLISEVVQNELQFNEDEIENLIEELQYKLQ